MSASIRLYVDATLADGVSVAASPEQAHYVRDVMRRPEGATLRLFNGRDGEWSAGIEAIGKRDIRFGVRMHLRPQAGQPDVWLVFAPLRRDATELVVQKATELGVARIVPVVTARTQPVRLRADRLRAIATEAAEQCERLSVPAIEAPTTLADLLQSWPPGRTLLACLERSGAPLLRATPPPLALLVGPEGGFTPAEQAMVSQAGQPVSLGSLVLRAETASIAGLALLLLPLPPPASAA